MARHERSTDLLSLETERRIEQAGFCAKPVKQIGSRPISTQKGRGYEPRISLGPLLAKALRTGSAYS